ncbi:MAG: metal-dependent transcriptional regulator [Treponema sp.]|nr:metal-dependent transcriptional regulator [Treponema sp.]
MTQSLEDYLEMVSFLDDEGPVRVTDIAARLGVSKPSVLAALRALGSQGFLEHERYRTVFLTDLGRRQAALIRERHSMLTSFLRDVIGVSADTADSDACKMEHHLSAETLDKMRDMVKTKQLEISAKT